MAPTGPQSRVQQNPSTAQPNLTSSKDDPPPPQAITDSSISHNRERGTKWYPGAWSTISRPSKAQPVTEVARESISIAKNVASSSSSLPEIREPARHPSLQLTRRNCTSVRSLPATATATCVNIASDGSASTPLAESETSKIVAQPTSTADSLKYGGTATAEDATKERDPSQVTASSINGQGSIGNSAQANGAETGRQEPAGWFSWVYGMPRKNVHVDNLVSTETPSHPVNQLHSSETTITPDPASLEGQDQAQIEPNHTSVLTPQKRSWLQMWSGSGNLPKGRQGPEPNRSAGPAGPDRETVPEPTAVEPHLDEIQDTEEALSPNKRSSGWSFWSKETPAKDRTRANVQDVQTVEASVTEEAVKEQGKVGPEAQPEVEITRKDTAKGVPKEPGEAAALSERAVGRATQTPTSAPPTPTRFAQTAASNQLQKALPNQILPRFQDTFSLQEQPSLLQRLGSYLHYTKEPEHKHVYRVKDPPRIRKALAIGVHGYFPAPLIRTVLGQPTGTSIKFSTMAATAIHKWTEDHGYECEIEKIALEGEGRIAERVDLLWKLLLNWMEHIRQADFILVACHSQGVPVATMLVAKLISFGCLSSSRIGICAMAGVNMGPFVDYKSRWISGSAGELFDFSVPYSQVSRDYEAALKCVLDFGARITFVGSLDDQLVSLESSLFSPASHPYIYRAAFVDGRVHAPSFLSHLIGFTLKLRNLGHSDHGLIRELSLPLAGSLYTSDGHSRLYDDANVYYLAIEFALETSTASNASLQINRPIPSSSSSTPNPYILPFSMRGILEEEYVRRELNDETTELLRQFDEWKPSTKVLKDVKFRLEGIRSKL